LLPTYLINKEAIYNYFLAKGQGKNIFSPLPFPLNPWNFMSSKQTPDHISSLLGEMISRRNWQERFELHDVFNFWEKAVSADIAKQARPVKFRGKVLWVEVSDSVWMQQLQFLKMGLLEKINREFKSVQVEDIRFQLRLPDREAPPPIRPPQRQAGPPPTGEAARQFQEELAQIADPELQAAMIRCWRTLFPYKDDR
jgi:hypothetical protein